MKEQNYYWYSVTVQYFIEDSDTGKVKKYKETYLVKAISVTDAEALVTEDLSGVLSDFRILTVNESRITRIIKSDKVDLND